MELKHYPDNTSYTIAKHATTYNNPHIFRINSYEDLWSLTQYVDSYNNIFENPPYILLPNLLDAQADRRFDKNESFGLKLVLKHLINLNANFKIFHPHNAEVVEMAFEICGKKVEIIDNSEFILRVLNQIGANPILHEKYHIEGTPNNYDNLVILLPDGGAYKWGVKLMDKLDFSGNVLAAAKNRKYKDGKSVLTQQLPDYDFTGKDVLLLDDLLIYGGTFKGLSKLLRERNCGKLYLAVSHMTVQDLGEDPVTNYFDKVFCTNSKYDEYIGGDFEYTNRGAGTKFQPKNLEIIKLF